MITLLHVLFALSSLGLATYNLINPEVKRLKISYGLAFATLGSGALLIVVNHASVLRTCATGLLFFAVVVTLNTLASRSLSTENN